MNAWAALYKYRACFLDSSMSSTYSTSSSVKISYRDLASHPSRTHGSLWFTALLQAGSELKMPWGQGCQVLL